MKEGRADMDSKILDLIKKQCKGKKHIKLTVGYITDGQSTIKMFDETGEIENKDYNYEIGSITKTFTASLLAKYIHERTISLDDPILNYISGLEGNRYYPTIKRLITHTSGYKRSLPYSKMGFKHLLRFLTNKDANEAFSHFLCMDESEMKTIMNKVRLTDKDYKWQYSNFAISLVGYAIGIVSGKGYRATMNEYLWNDLDLLNSYAGTDSNRNIPGYRKKSTSGGNVNWGDNLIRPAGDISSTAKDLLRYAEINYNDELPYLSICHQKYAKVSYPFNKMFDIDMGLGWWVGRNDNSIIMHGGDTATFSSILIVDKKHKSAVVVLSNYPGNSAKLLKIAKPLLLHIFN